MRILKKIGCILVLAGAAILMWATGVFSVCESAGGGRDECAVVATPFR